MTHKLPPCLVFIYVIVFRFLNKIRIEGKVFYQVNKLMIDLALSMKIKFLHTKQGRNSSFIKSDLSFII